MATKIGRDDKLLYNKNSETKLNHTLIYFSFQSCLGPSLVDPKLSSVHFLMISYFSAILVNHIVSCPTVFSLITGISRTAVVEKLLISTLLPS